MKRIFLFIILLVVFVLWFSFAAVNDKWYQIHGIATWYNVNMDFDAQYSNVEILPEFKSNVCWTNLSGFLLTWHVNREWNGFVYFWEDDGDDSISSCVAVVLSGQNFYLTGVWHTSSWKWYKMSFNNINLVFNKSTKKTYILTWKAYDDALWVVWNWNNVYITWLNLIDWSKTEIQTWNYIANGTNGYIKILFKDKTDNPVVIVDSVNVEIVNTSSDLSGYVYLDENKHLSKKYSLNNGYLSLPIYILKATNAGKIALKFSYDIPDEDGNKFHVVNLSNLKVKNPISDFNINVPSNTIVWDDFTWNISVSYVNNEKWNINSIVFTWDINTDSHYNLDFDINNYTFTWKVVPKDPDNTISKVESNYKIRSYKVWFSNFKDIKVSYGISKVLKIDAYADKRVDKNYSFTGLILKKEFVWWDKNNTLSFTPILKDRHGYLIPDIKFDIKIKDVWNANSISSWDCDELDVNYQTNCNALQFISNSTTYKWNVDWVLWTKFNYENNISNYPDVKVVSYKPISWWNLRFEITNLENTSSNWNFADSWNYISMPSNYNWYIKNIIFKPFFNLKLAGLDDEMNYIDVNNDIYLKLSNDSSFNLSNIDYYLSWQITQPTHGVSFIDGWILTWINKFIRSNNSILLDQTILFSLDYAYNNDIKLNYNHGYYTYNITWVGNLKLIPWNVYFDLSATYKFGGTFVNGLINQTQKYAASVKNTIWRKNKSISARFYTVYNSLRKKANYLVQWLPVNSWWKLVIDTLDGGVKYYNCNWNSLSIDWWTYKWINTIIAKNCRLIIKWNILKNDKNSNLVFFLFDDDGFDLSNVNYLTRKSNIYIYPSVSDIQAALLTKWSIFTTTNGVNISNIFMENRVHSINEKQLFIQGALMWQNNVWGSFLVNWEKEFTIWGNRKINLYDNIWWKTSLHWLRNIAQVFDINFWRWFKYNKWWNTIDPDWYSNYCDKWNNKEVGCRYPVYIQFDPTIRSNVLLR